MRAAIYARCSTNDQSVGPQLDALRAYAVARQLEVVEEFIDEGFSGARDRRPALDRLMAAAKRREFETLRLRVYFHIGWAGTRAHERGAARE